MSIKTHALRHTDPELCIGVDVFASCTPVNTDATDDETIRLTRIRAYELWEQAGRPEGESERDKFWTDAQLEMLVCDATDD